MSSSESDSTPPGDATSTSCRSGEWFTVTGFQIGLLESLVFADRVEDAVDAYGLTLTDSRTGYTHNFALHRNTMFALSNILRKAARGIPPPGSERPPGRRRLALTTKDAGWPRRWYWKWMS